MSTAALYVRSGVDPDGQALVRQEREARRIAFEHRYEVVAVYRGRGDDSAAFRDFLDAARARAFDAVVVTTVNRLGRSSGRIEAVIETGLTLVDESGVFDLASQDGRLMARMQVAVGEHTDLQDAARRASSGTGSKPATADAPATPARE
jgi:DNA invertase Pin-like site-specific DNA recombinase